MDQTKIPESKVEIDRNGSLITVTLVGSIDETLTESLQARLELELSREGDVSILYDSLYMTDPSLGLVLMMQTFHNRLARQIAKSAIVVPGYRLAYLSRLAFGEDKNKYRVFYHDRQEAIDWLSAASA